MRFGRSHVDARTVTPVAIAAAVTALAVTLPSPAAALSDAETMAIGDRVAAYRFEPLSGGDAVSVSDLEGEVVVVNFWATWCKPCQAELPLLDALNARISPRGGRVLAVSIDRDARRAERFVNERGLALPVVHDGPDGLVETLDLAQFPFTVVFDRTGRAVFTTHETDDEALAELSARVDALLGEAPVRIAQGGDR